MKVSFAVLCSVTEVKTKSKISDGLTDLIVPKVMSSRLCEGCPETCRFDFQWGIIYYYLMHFYVIYFFILYDNLLFYFYCILLYLFIIVLEINEL